MFSKEVLIKDLELMLRIRRFEERTAQAYQMKLIGGFCHLYIGQEAVIVGMKSEMSPDDTMIGSYRTHGHMIACDMDSNLIMSELMGKNDGYSKGKGGSMHMFAKDHKFYGGHGIVGAPVAIGTGIALAMQYKKMHAVSLTFFGDGAANQGQVYESYNMAALWKLPVLYIIENNLYGMGTSVRRACANHKKLYERGMPFGIPGESVDGMNVMAVRKSANKALKYCRSGKGPYILEMHTYRYRGHSMSDPATYRTAQEVNTMRTEHDPISHLSAYLIEKKYLTQNDIDLLDQKAKAYAKDAFNFSNNSPLPVPSELWTDMYKES